MTDALQTTLVEGTHYFMHGGRMLPIVRGGDGPSDIGDTGGGADTGAGPAADVVDASPPADTGGSASTPETPTAPAGTDQDTFDRAYVEKLRQESAGYRTRAKTYDEAFDGFDDESRDVFLGLARDLVNSPESAARRMIEVSRQLLGEDFDSALTGPPPALTREDAERLWAEKEAARGQEDAIRAVQNEARELGYKDDTPDMSELFWFASNQTGGDLKAAHEKVEARKQAAIDEFLEKKRAAGESFTTPTTAGITAGGDGEPAHTFAEARARAEARFAAQPGT